MDDDTITLDERIGRQLRVARESRGWTQEQFGSELHDRSRLVGRLGRPWSKQTISAAEAGGREFGVEELLIFALIFDVPMRRFLEPHIDHIGKRVKLSSGWLINDDRIERAAGRSINAATNIATQMQELAKQVESLVPSESEEQ